MSSPTVVHPPAGPGGRRVTMRGEFLGLVHSERDVASSSAGRGHR
ncbi:hypothetical protein [Streptomyces sp. NPDC021622]